MLTHRNWKFEKFMTQKIQSNDLSRIQATTGDNVVLETDANVNWWIYDVALAARMAAETMRPDGRNIQGEDITKIREDVLKQAQASLSAFIGSLRYSDTVHVSHGVQDASDSKLTLGQPAATGMGGAGQLFDGKKLKSAVHHANDLCKKYGVEILTINVISAFPTDRDLNEALAKGATASAEAEMAETSASGNAKALMIRAQAEAEAQRIRAQAAADAERIRAQGSMDAANKLETSAVAVDFARMQTIGGALQQKKVYHCGGMPHDLPTMVTGVAGV